MVYEAAQEIPRGATNHAEVSMLWPSDEALDGPDMQLMFIHVPIYPATLEASASSFTFGVTTVPESRGSVPIASSRPGSPAGHRPELPRRVRRRRPPGRRRDRGPAARRQTASVERGRHVAESLHTGIVHINNQTLNNDAYAPLGGTGASGNGARFGTQSSWDEFTTWQWITSRTAAHPFPF